MSIDRRFFLRLASTSSLTLLASRMNTIELQNAQWLMPTRYIDCDHHAIKTLSLKLSEGLNSDQQKSIRIFQYVRDEIYFGFTSAFYAQKASDVLQSKIGYCNTKATLLIALLRAAGIPARQIFVSIDSNILDGIVDTGTSALDHSYTEVFLEGNWLATDAYVVDTRLAKSAKARLRRERKSFGYGMHVNGTSDWNAALPSFSQYIDDARVSPRFGQFTDVDDFYQRALKPWNKLGPIARVFSNSIFAKANRNIESIRNLK
jgi:transglutaminase-like putative cysteine protease